MEYLIATAPDQADLLIEKGYGEQSDMTNISIETKDGDTAFVPFTGKSVSTKNITLNGEEYQTKPSPAFSLSRCIDILGYPKFEQMMRAFGKYIHSSQELLDCIVDCIIDPDSLEGRLDKDYVLSLNGALERDDDVVLSFGDSENNAVWHGKDKSLDATYKKNTIHIEAVDTPERLQDAIRLVLGL